MEPGDTAAPKEQAVRLFLVGFLVLFLELACIRWFAAFAVFLQFFTNVILIACFLGMSCGCLAARSRRDWLAATPFLALGAVLAAVVTLVVYHAWSGLVLDVGDQTSPQEVFFGTEYRDPDVAQFVLPIEAIAAFFFVLIALVFVGVGQVLGRAFDAYPDRVRGYTLNIGGSLAGIVAFAALSFLHAPPVVWFLVGCAGIAYLLRRDRKLTRGRIAAMATLLVLVCANPTLTWPVTDYVHHAVRWSPYYAVDHDERGGKINVNTISHQEMVPFAEGGSSYSLIHLLRRGSGGAPFGDVLVIGAGSGNDVAHALRFDARHVDAVEIDPVIQGVGVRHHPDRPYQDPRVARHVDDGRHFLRTTGRKYDLVVYALVDSLILHSGYANIRLESYLFTEQAFEDVRRVLKPNGVFVTYNWFRRGWIVERVAAMAGKVFDCTPTVLSLPYRETIEPETAVGFTMVIATSDPGMADALKRPFWMNVAPPRNLDVDGFAVEPADDSWERIAPSALARADREPEATSDDWPFLYLRTRLIPNLNIRSMLILGVLGLLLVGWFMPGRRLRIHTRMFFLGAAFMLLETKAVVQLALLFGSTWTVNAAVFFTVLVLILFANLYVLKVPGVKVGRHYAMLFGLLAANLLVPLDAFLGGAVLWRYAAPCALALGPMFFAGVVFALSFRDSAEPDQAFGSNIAGSVVGGLAESFSMLLGFRYLLLLAVVFYLASLAPRLSACLSRRART